MVQPEIRTKRYYAATCKDRSLLEESSSGGVFGVLAAMVIKAGGVVYGAAFDKDFAVSHVRCATLQDLPELYGSKYIQSSLDKVYETLCPDLEQSIVLFSGTPCQVAAIKNYIQARHLNAENLIACDLLCHGVPSPSIWNEYLDLQQANIGEITAVKFRSKKKDWINFSLKLTGEKHIYENSHSKDFFMRLFLGNYILRESCYSCFFATKERVGDITIGDYWGIQKAHPDFYDERGVSLCMVNTEKGSHWFERCKPFLDTLETSFAQCVQPVFNGRSAKKPKGYARFWEVYHSKGLKKAMHVLPSYRMRRIRNLIVRIFAKILRTLGLYGFVRKLVKGEARQ
jgi:coenzyme F420-reducing hydrogenase beta subunit